MRVQPYLFLQGRCEEAINFYRETLGAKVTTLLRFKDTPGAGSEEDAERIMHAAFTLGDLEILASDGDIARNPEFKGMYLSVTFEGVEEAQRAFAALAEGGEVRMPFEKTFFSPGFGLLADRFGVLWMINVAA